VTAVASAEPYSYKTPGQLFIETFDSLPNAPENTALPDPWVDDLTLPHWMAITTIEVPTEGGFHRFRITHGNTSGGSIYSFGAANDTDRALGSIGSTTVGDVYWGTRFHNDTGRTLNQITFTYSGEQWRDGGATAPAISVAQTIDFQFSLSATGIFGEAFKGAVDVNALDFVSPIFGSSNAVSYDGNAPANRVLLSSTIRGFQWLPDTDLFVRWIDINHLGNDHGMAIDDFSIVANTPEPCVFPAAALAAAAMFSRRRLDRPAAGA
jgi:hypothetical protein